MFLMWWSRDLSLQVAIRPLLWTNKGAGPLHFSPPCHRGRAQTLCAAHRPADTATRPARDLPLGHRVDIYWRKLHGELQGVDCPLVTSHSRIQKPVLSTPPFVSYDKRNNEAVRRSMSLTGPTTMRRIAFIPRLVPLSLKFLAEKYNNLKKITPNQKQYKFKHAKWKAYMFKWIKVGSVNGCEWIFVAREGTWSLVDREEQWKAKKEKLSEMDWVCWGPDVAWMDQTSAGSARPQRSWMTSIIQPFSPYVPVNRLFFILSSLILIKWFPLTPNVL